MMIPVNCHLVIIFTQNGHHRSVQHRQKHRNQYIHEITMCLTVDFAWDAEKPTTRESSPYIRLEREEGKTLVEVQEMSNI